MPQVCQECSSLLREAESASHDHTLQQQQLDALRRAVNPYAAESSRLTRIEDESREALSDLSVQRGELQKKVRAGTIHSLKGFRDEGLYRVYAVYRLQHAM